MTQILVSSTASGLFALLLVACAIPDRPPPPPIPGCIDGGPFVVDDQFEVTFTAFDKEQELVPTHLRSIPDAQRQIMQSQAVRAQESFLIINYTIRNITKSPKAWMGRGEDYFLILRRDDGSVFQSALMLSDFGGATPGQAFLNPGMSLDASTVFDAPDGNYSAIILNQKIAGRTSISRIYNQRQAVICNL